ncbi:MAG: MFS transporter [Pseudomonadota bacterium]
MFGVLSDRTYRHLFLAQVVALLGTGLTTVALGLLAFDLAGDRAALVLGAALTIKMVAYVAVAPIAAAFADRVPRRTMLVALDLVRAGIALSLPFVTQIWQIYILIFLMQAASAAFMPTFQATIPDVLPEEARYTRALSLSRLAYDLESLLSPVLAALLLMVLSYNALFLGTVAGFLASALLIVSVALPSPAPATRRGIYDRTTRGIRIFLSTPRLRGLLGLNLTVAAGSAMILVNTVVLVLGDLKLQDGDVAIAMGAFGAGSMITALSLPRLLDRWPDRPIMVGAAWILVATLVVFAAATALSGVSWPALLMAWAVSGICYSAVQTPAGRLLRRSAHAEDRPAVFAAQFALSHACWLITYPLAGALMTGFGPVAALLGLAALGGLGAALGQQLWPRDDPQVLTHSHEDLPPDHPHLQGSADRDHEHAFVIDDLHDHWPEASDMARR